MYRRQQIGFTLVELMIVVAIISVLAVIAGTAYRRYMDSGRSAEVYAMLGEIRTKEEAYKAEFGSYLGTNTSETTFYPALLGKGYEPKPKTWAGSSVPSGWTNLGINPTKGQLYAGYVVIAGAANAGPSGTRGAAIFASSPSGKPTVAWWYAVATLDNDSDGNTATNEYFTTSSQTTNVFVENEHR